MAEGIPSILLQCYGIKPRAITYIVGRQFTKDHLLSAVCGVKKKSLTIFTLRGFKLTILPPLPPKCLEYTEHTTTVTTK